MSRCWCVGGRARGRPCRDPEAQARATVFGPAAGAGAAAAPRRPSPRSLAPCTPPHPTRPAPPHPTPPHSLPGDLDGAISDAKSAVAAATCEDEKQRAMALMRCGAAAFCCSSALLLELLERAAGRRGIALSREGARGRPAGQPSCGAGAVVEALWLTTAGCPGTRSVSCSAVIEHRVKLGKAQQERQQARPVHRWAALPEQRPVRRHKNSRPCLSSSAGAFRRRTRRHPSSATPARPPTHPPTHPLVRTGAQLPRRHRPDRGAYGERGGAACGGRHGARARDGRDLAGGRGQARLGGAGKGAAPGTGAGSGARGGQVRWRAAGPACPTRCGSLWAQLLLVGC